MNREGWNFLQVPAWPTAFVRQWWATLKECEYYAVHVGENKRGEFVATLCTLQGNGNGGERHWTPCKNPYHGVPSAVMVEAERRVRASNAIEKKKKTAVKKGKKTAKKRKKKKRRA